MTPHSVLPQVAIVNLEPFIAAIFKKFQQNPFTIQDLNQEKSILQMSTPNSIRLKMNTCKLYQLFNIHTHYHYSLNDLSVRLLSDDAHLRQNAIDIAFSKIEDYRRVLVLKQQHALGTSVEDVTTCLELLDKKHATVYSNYKSALRTNLRSISAALLNQASPQKPKQKTKTHPTSHKRSISLDLHVGGDIDDQIAWLQTIVNQLNVINWHSHEEIVIVKRIRG